MQPNIMPGIITITESDVLQKYTNTINTDEKQKGIVEDLKKFADYWGAQQASTRLDIALTVSGIFLSYLIMGAAVGGAVGSLIGGGAGALITSGPGAVPGAVEGGKIGAVIGLIPGISFFTKNINVIVFRSPTYSNWVTKCRTDDVYSIYIKIIQEDGAFDDYLCNITQDFPNMPVRCPNGYLYDKQAIESWVDRQTQQLLLDIEANRVNDIEDSSRNICPRRIKGFAKEQLVFQNNFYEKLNSLVLEKLKENESNQSNELVKAGLNALLTANKENQEAIVGAHIGSLYMFCSKNNLPNRIADIARDRLIERFKKGKI